jgi:hypothetical protein
MGWASRAKGEQELFRRDFSLAQQSREPADLDLPVHRDDTPFRRAPHDHGTTALTNLGETRTLEGADDLSPRDMGQLRHLPARGW